MYTLWSISRGLLFTYYIVVWSGVGEIVPHDIVHPLHRILQNVSRDMPYLVLLAAEYIDQIVVFTTFTFRVYF